MKSLHKFLIPICFLLVAFNCNAAVDVFMKITDQAYPEAKAGDGSSVSGYEGWYSVLALSMGASSDVQVGATGGSRARSNPSFQDVSISKWADGISAHLLLSLATGAVIDKIEITSASTGGSTGKAPVVLSEIILEDVYVSSVSGGGVSGDDRFVENITLAWTKMTYKSYSQDDKGASSLAKEVMIDRESNTFR